jgi:hypothetical protein
MQIRNCLCNEQGINTIAIVFLLELELGALVLKPASWQAGFGNFGIVRLHRPAERKEIIRSINPEISDQSAMPSCDLMKSVTR